MTGLRREVRKNRTLYAMTIPGVALLFLFNYLPMVGVLLAFKNYRLDQGIFGSPWSGPLMENFKFFFTGAYAWRVTRNTLFLNLAFLASGLLFEGSFALILNEIRSRFLKRTIQSLAFFPYFISWIVVGFFAFSMLNYDYGVLNTTLKVFGLAPVGWYSNPSYWPWILVFINRWKWTGYGAIIYLAVLSSIDPGQYEAAEIDGATRWQRVWYISIPHMIPTMAMLTLLGIGRIMNADFGMFYAVVGGNSMVYPTADVIDTFVFRSIRKLGDYGMAAATGLYQSVLSFVLIVISNAIANRYFGNSGLFSFSPEITIMSGGRNRVSLVQFILNAVIIAFALACLYPFLLVVAGSVTNEYDIVHGGLHLVPQHLSLYAYDTLFHNVKRVVNAYSVTIFVTVVGTGLSIIVTSLLAYPLSRRDLKYRNPILFYVFFTMLFNGGMLPWYIVCVRILHLRETIFALILPYLVVAWYVFLLRNYFQALPNEIAESAKIDGAGEIGILFKIVMPLSKPALAVILLFIGLMYWNDWWLGIMLIDGERLRPLQLMLLSITSGIELLSTNTSSQARSAIGQMIPREGVKFATTLITIGPIILLYPFVQKYFVKGIIMGALKG